MRRLSSLGGVSSGSCGGGPLVARDVGRRGRERSLCDKAAVGGRVVEKLWVVLCCFLIGVLSLIVPIILQERFGISFQAASLAAAILLAALSAAAAAFLAVAVCVGDMLWFIAKALCMLAGLYRREQTKSMRDKTVFMTGAGVRSCRARPSFRILALDVRPGSSKIFRLGN